MGDEDDYEEPRRKRSLVKYTLYAIGGVAFAVAGAGAGIAIYNAKYGNSKVQGVLNNLLPSRPAAADSSTGSPIASPSGSPTYIPTDFPTYVPTNGDVSPLQTAEMIMSMDTDEPERRILAAREGEGRFLKSVKKGERKGGGYAFGRGSARPVVMHGRDDREEG
ncbi:hypothetical protein ACHAWF_003602 [Thalassiosira exigua]